LIEFRGIVLEQTSKTEREYVETGRQLEEEEVGKG
jgi:hypothetical protein